MAQGALIDELSHQRMTNLTASREPDHKLSASTGRS